METKIDLLSTKEAADFLGISNRTLRRDQKKANPSIPCKKIGGRYYYIKDNIKEMLN